MKSPRFKTIRSQTFIAMFFILSAMVGATLFFSYTVFENERVRLGSQTSSIHHNALNYRIHSEIFQRVSESRSLAKELLPELKDSSQPKTNAFENLPRTFYREVLAVTFFTQKDDGNLELLKLFPNQKLLQSRSLDNRTISMIYRSHPLPLKEFLTDRKLRILNRSIEMKKDSPLTVLTLLMGGESLDNENRNIIIAVDVLQDFLHRQLASTAGEQTFLVIGKGKILSHPDPSVTTRYVKTFYPNINSRDLESVQINTSEIRRGKERLLLRALSREHQEITLASINENPVWIDSLRVFLEGLGWNPIIAFAIGNLLVFIAVSVTTSKKKIRLIAEENLVEDPPKDSDLKTDSPSKDRAELKKKHAFLAKFTESSDEFFDILAPKKEVSGTTLCFLHESSGMNTLLIGEVLVEGKKGEKLTKAAHKYLTKQSKGREKISPGELLSLLNSWGLKQKYAEPLMTAVAMGLNTAQNNLAIAGGGHELPILFSSSSSLYSGKKLECENQPIGTAADTEYPVNYYPLKAGDFVIAYCGSLLDVANQDGDPQGEAGIVGIEQLITSKMTPEDLNAKIFDTTLALSTSDTFPIDYLILKWNQESLEKAAPKTSIAESSHLNERDETSLNSKSLLDSSTTTEQTEDIHWEPETASEDTQSNEETLDWEQDETETLKADHSHTEDTEEETAIFDPAPSHSETELSTDEFHTPEELTQIGETPPVNQLTDSTDKDLTDPSLLAEAVPEDLSTTDEASETDFFDLNSDAEEREKYLYEEEISSAENLKKKRAA